MQRRPAHELWGIHCGSPPREPGLSDLVTWWNVSQLLLPPQPPPAASLPARPWTDALVPWHPLFPDLTLTFGLIHPTPCFRVFLSKSPNQAVAPIAGPCRVETPGVRVLVCSRVGNGVEGQDERWGRARASLQGESRRRSCWSGYCSSIPRHGRDLGPSAQPFWVQLPSSYPHPH